MLVFGVYLPSFPRKIWPSPQPLAYPSGSLSPPSKLQESYEPADVSFHHSPLLSSVLINKSSTFWGLQKLICNKKHCPPQTNNSTNGKFWWFRLVLWNSYGTFKWRSHESEPPSQTMSADLCKAETNWRPQKWETWADIRNDRNDANILKFPCIYIYIYYLEIQIPPEPVFGPLKHTYNTEPQKVFGCLGHDDLIFCIWASLVCLYYLIHSCYNVYKLKLLP